MAPRRLLAPLGKLKLSAFLSLLCAAVAVGLSCEQDRAAPAPLVTPEHVQFDADEARYVALRQKLNTYISDCTNRQTEAVYRGREQVQAWVEESRADSDASAVELSSAPRSLKLNPIDELFDAPTSEFLTHQTDMSRGQPSFDVPHPTTPAPAQCINAVAQAAKIEPHAPELERAASEYAQALSLVSPLLSQTQGQSQPPAKAGGRALRQEIYKEFSAAWERFDAANQALMQQIQTVKAELDQRTLQRLEREGPEIDYLAKVSLMAAQRLSETGRLELTDPKKLNVAEYLRLLSEYERKLDAMAAFASHNSPKINGASVTPYLHESQAFLIAAKALAERVRSRQGLAQADAQSAKPEAVSPVRLLVNFNGVIGAYNAAQHAGGFARL